MAGWTLNMELRWRRHALNLRYIGAADVPFRKQVASDSS